MARDSITLKELDEQGRDIRVWCLSCRRSKRFDTWLWNMKGWDLTLAEAAKRFKCSRCKSKARVIVLPGLRIALPPADARQITTDMVAAYYFGARKAGKKDRNGGYAYFPHRVDWWKKRR